MWGAICRIVCNCMPPLSQEQKDQTLVQLRSGVSTRKVVALVGMSQSFVVHLRKDVGGEIDRQRGRHPKLLANREKRLCVTLVTEGWFGTAFATTKQLRFEICKLLFDITVRHALKEVRLNEQVQQRKSFMNRKHVLTRLRFAQRYENQTIDDWKHVIFGEETKI